MIRISSKGFRCFIFLFFLLSGFSGLIYQIVWLRMAFANFGVITPVLSVVISVFMMGLAVGAWGAGKYINDLCKFSGYTPLLFYGIVELMIGLGGLLVPIFFSCGQNLLLNHGDINSFSYLLLSAIIVLISLLPWCVCMGATIPIMLAFIRQLDGHDETGFSYLYLANVIGAMCGALIAAFVLIETVGLMQTTHVAVFVNVLIASICLAINFFHNTKHIEYEEDQLTSRKSALNSSVLSFEVLVILFVTGFVSMGMEVVWTRAFTPALHTTVYSFASILIVYLLSTWIGSWIYRKHVLERRVLGVDKLVARLCWFCLLPIMFCDPRITNDSILSIMFVLISIFPCCCLLGYMTPKLIDEYARGYPKHAGTAYAANTMGCILGPLFAGYLLLPQMGSRLSLLALSSLVGLVFLYYLRLLWSSNRVYTVANLLIIIILGSSSYMIFFTYEDSRYYEKQIVRHDYTATVVSRGEGLNKDLLVNGIGMTGLTPVTKCMIHLPLSVRKVTPESALIICFGMGTTFRSSTTWGVKTTAIELVPSVRDAFEYYFRDAKEVMGRPGAAIVVDDGRRYLKRTKEKYDVITIDPPPPVESSGSSLLYSTDFYEIVKDHLKKEGLLAQWLPGGEESIIKATANSIKKAFPYVRVYRSLEGSGLHFFASMQPFEMPTTSEFLERMPNSAEKDMLEWWRKDTRLTDIYEHIIQGEIHISRLLPSDSEIMITDDRPYNEYYFVRRFKTNLRRIWGY